MTGAVALEGAFHHYERGSQRLAALGVHGDRHDDVHQAIGVFQPDEAGAFGGGRAAEPVGHQAPGLHPGAAAQLLQVRGRTGTRPAQRRRGALRSGACRPSRRCRRKCASASGRPAWARITARSSGMSSASCGAGRRAMSKASARSHSSCRRSPSLSKAPARIRFSGCPAVQAGAPDKIGQRAEPLPRRAPARWPRPARRRCLLRNPGRSGWRRWRRDALNPGLGQRPVGVERQELHPHALGFRFQDVGRISAQRGIAQQAAEIFRGVMHAQPGRPIDDDGRRPRRAPC